MDSVPDTTRLQLGQLMVDDGFLTHEQLSHALIEQSRTGQPLDKVLVDLGYVSRGAVANALHDQQGGIPRTDHGASASDPAAPLGAGLRLAQPRAAEPALEALAAAADSSELQPDPVGREERASTESAGEATHVLFVPTSTGYRLVERAGAAPEAGDAVELEAGRFVVRRLGPSPLPGSGRRCAYLERG